MATLKVVAAIVFMCLALLTMFSAPSLLGLNEPTYFDHSICPSDGCI